MLSYFRNLKPLLGKLIFDKKRKQIQIVWTVVRLGAAAGSCCFRGSAHIRCTTVKTIIIDIFRAGVNDNNSTMWVSSCVFFFFLCSHKRLCLNDPGRVPVPAAYGDKNEPTRSGTKTQNTLRRARCKRALVKPHVHACSLTTVVKRSFFFKTPYYFLFIFLLFLPPLSSPNNTDSGRAENKRFFFISHYYRPKRPAPCTYPTIIITTVYRGARLKTVPSRRTGCTPKAFGGGQKNKPLYPLPNTRSSPEFGGIG